MDKYSGYVIVVYVVTLALLLGYLGWLWLRLRNEPEVTPSTTDTATAWERQ